MQMKNEIMLITYADSFGRNLSEMRDLLARHYEGAISGLHILPFFPSSADRGFAPITYTQVDPAFGAWADIDALGNRYYLMFDFMINHMSTQSPYYQDMLARGKRSPYWPMFLHYRDFWPDGAPTQQQLDLVYKRKPREPYIEAELADGTLEKLWCTFSAEQVDLDMTTAETKAFIRDTLQGLMAHRLSILRLDAFAYAIKKPDTNCFFVEPEIWHLLADVQTIVDSQQVVLLPEIHEHYSLQLELAQKGYWVYDFALPMLVLYTLYTGDTAPLVHWLSICPRQQFTTLDTHDGIGVVDVKDLLTDAQIELTRNLLYDTGANVSRIYSTELYNNLDVYQINCTYYSALGNEDAAYLLARAIQFFAPGIPQVYYVGLLAGENDLELVQRTQQGRDINRHNYTAAEVADALSRPVVQKLRQLMVFRNQCPAFHGELTIETSGTETLVLRRSFGSDKARLTAHCKTHAFTVESKHAHEPWQCVLQIP